MVKPIVLVIATIPAILAILIAIPLITQSEIPYSASNSNDVIEIEYNFAEKWATFTVNGKTDKLTAVGANPNYQLNFYFILSSEMDSIKVEINKQ